jgi:hypothetical protein
MDSFPDDPFLDQMVDIVDAAYLIYRRHPTGLSRHVWAVLLGLFADMVGVWREYEDD